MGRKRDIQSKHKKCATEKYYVRANLYIGLVNSISDFDGEDDNPEAGALFSPVTYLFNLFSTLQTVLMLTRQTSRVSCLNH